MLKISAVIPCYNEALSIGKVITSLPKEIKEIIVIDNNSNDNTAEIAKNLGATVIFEKKQGYGYAVKRGFASANGDYIVTLDGDGQHPTSKIMPMLEYMIKENIDFISGNRFPMQKKTGNFTRKIGNWLLTFLTNFLFGLNMKDSQSGMWIFQKEVLKKINLISNDMSISEEIKIKVAINKNLKFAEYYIPYYPRLGSSKLSPIRHGIKNIFFLLYLRFKNNFE